MKPVEVCKGNLFETEGILGVNKKALEIYFLLLVKHTYSFCKQTAHHIAYNLHPYPDKLSPILLLINTHLQEFLNVFTSLIEDFRKKLYVHVVH